MWYKDIHASNMRANTHTHKIGKNNNNNNNLLKREKSSIQKYLQIPHLISGAQNPCTGENRWTMTTEYLKTEDQE